MEYERKTVRPSFWERLWINSPFCTSLAIDVDSISRISFGNRTNTPAEVMRVYKDYKILYYKGQPPIVLKNGWLSRIRLVNVESMTDEEKKKAIKLLKGD